MKKINRRTFLSGIGSSLAFLCINSSAAAKKTSIEQSGLAEVFKDRFRIGTAISSDTFVNNNSRLLRLIAREFNTITAENDMKWEMIRPSLDNWNWEVADKFVEYGLENQMLMVV